jgi:hypothetical protein
MRTLKNSLVVLVSASVLGPLLAVTAYATTILASAFVGQ